MHFEIEETDKVRRPIRKSFDSLVKLLGVWDIIIAQEMREQTEMELTQFVSGLNKGMQVLLEGEDSQKMN